MNIQDEFAALCNALGNGLASAHDFTFGAGGCLDGPVYDLTDPAACETLLSAAEFVDDVLPHVPERFYLALVASPNLRYWACFEKGQHEDEGELLAMHLFRLRNDGWFSAAMVGIMRRDGMTICVSFPRNSASKQDALHYRELISVLARAIAYLNQREVNIEYHPASSFYEASSRRLVRLGKAALPPIRKISLSAVLQSYPRTQPTGDAAGPPVAPHDRRSHMRHLRSGKVVPVRSSTIHGGSAATFYKVVA